MSLEKICVLLPIIAPGGKRYSRPEGEGTAMGLATVYGIVKQNNGFINVYSEPGQGGIFRIYLPGSDAADSYWKPSPASGNLQTGTETILLVEDEPTVLEMARRTLERLGYQVLATRIPK